MTQYSFASAFASVALAVLVTPLSADQQAVPGAVKKFQPQTTD
jgi:hypothetical protein